MVEQVTGPPQPAQGDSARAVIRSASTVLQRAAGGAGPAGWIVRLALPAALGLWAFALTRTRLDRMGDLGLLQALPPAYWAALVLLTVGFVVGLRTPRISRAWSGAYVLGLIAIIHATPSLLYPSLRYAWAWKHVAIVDAMLRHNGTVPEPHNLDIYNQWPGFFQLNVLILRVTGLHSALGYASWYPVIANVLLLAPLLAIFRTLTQDRRLVWGAVWLYFSTSWVGQDYFSPQAFAYLLFLTVLAMVLRRLPARQLHPAGAPADSGARALGGPPEARPRRGWRPLPFCLLVVLTAAIVSSHQLTPLMLISFLTMLAVPRRNRRVVLPALAVAVGLTFLWDATVAHPYLSTNVGNLVGALTSPDRNALPGLSRLGAMAPAQLFASMVVKGLTVGMALLALSALVVHRWTRHTALPWLLVAPVPLLLANGYGGEMIFRAYLFALPAAAFLAATVLIPTATRHGAAVRLRVWGSTAVMLALLGSLFFGYYSKEQMNYFTPDEVAATRYVADAAPPGARVVTVTGDLPGGELRYDEHELIVLANGALPDRQLLVNDTAAELETQLNQLGAGGPVYLVLTRGQVAESRLTGVFPAGTLEKVRAAADGSPDLRPVFSTPDAVVYHLVGPSTQAAGGN
ncbi:hypothetical protein GCM10010441_76020 [Kitasatospora paracochleata]|uniref:Glycosyltransferase n=1 Tax=Kitasatospora paracochleata TaxID=58354 RepID=A0ABT1IU08_9ACTN|nr:glycosyltransferase [Kitasatospora paracochleata]MCP2308616.1 hypothetical protein [Kitasatospora paracochleata]